MSDQTSGDIFRVAEDFFAAHLRAYLRSGGAEGHILDTTHAGGLPFGTHCLIRYKGRKSGKTYIAPLCYGDVGGEVAIIGSKGGADHHPDWYLNLVAAPEVDFQIATQAFHATWREAQGAEREKVYSMMTGNFPLFNNYRKATSLQIPVVLMRTVEPIAIFSEADLT
ncbi:MAG: nitroreductase family deazaflavin-dependent oxidoreductase [Alphaproteobacteria bacterium]|nr:nitroreductase family deazaflavin-dependent oxidoreductase [Alphaproteobacteria bacterium]